MNRAYPPTNSQPARYRPTTSSRPTTSPPTRAPRAGTRQVSPGQANPSPPKDGRQQQRQEVERQVDAMLGRSLSFRNLSPAQQAQIRADTVEVVETMASNKQAQAQRRAPQRDPYAIPLTGGIGGIPPITLPGQQPAG